MEWRGLGGMFSFSSEMQLLEQATSSQPTPTPGYLYEEIVQLSFKSNAWSEKVVEVLLNKLQHKESPVICLKALKVLRYLGEKGHFNCTQLLQRNDDSLKPFLNFTAPPDPLTGDALSQAIRKETKELLHILFNREAVNKQSTPQHVQVATSLSSDGATNTTEEEKLSIAAEGSKLFQALANKLVPQTNSLSNFGNPTGTSTTYSQRRDTQREHVAGQPGGSWFTEKDEEKVRQLAVESTSEEKKLVEDITEIGNKLTPSHSALAEFCNRALTLDRALLFKLLQEKLQADIKWQIKLRTLSVVESLLRANVQGARDYFSSISSLIRKQTSSVNKTTQDKARKILLMLGVSELEQNAEPNSAQTDQKENLKEVGEPLIQL